MGLFDSLGSFGSKFGEGLVGGLTSPETITGALGLFASSQLQKKNSDDQLKLTQQAAQTKFDNELAILNLKHQQDLELLQLKGAGGGGGGGGGSAAAMAIANAELALKRKELAQQKAIAKMNAMQNARQMELESTVKGGDSVQRAIEAMLQGATAPLGR